MPVFTEYCNFASSTHKSRHVRDAYTDFDSAKEKCFLNFICLLVSS